MKKIKREIKLLYTFIIIFIVCAFLLLFNIVLILSKQTKITEKKDFEKISQSVVSIRNGTTQAKGSGFIYKIEKNRAYILTNNHVVENSNYHKVYILNDNYKDATLHGYDKNLDVAVLSIENDNYKALELNKNNNISLGDTVYTMGTPLDNEFFNSLSSGIISNTNRFRIETNAEEEILMNMIQTDIITNPGNSGGPLLNNKLEVIGICTSNIETNNVSGISFAVPIVDVINKLTDLEKEGQIPERKISNIEIVDIKDSETLYKNNLIDLTEEAYGVVVLNDNESSSLKKGDIILKIDNNLIKDINYYKYYLNKYSKDDKVKLKIKRDNKEKNINVILK